MKIDGRFFGVLTIAALAAVIPLLLGVELRVVSAVAGIVAMVVLSWQVAATWTEVTVLVHALGLILIAMLFLGALGQYEFWRRGNVSNTFAAYPLLGTRVAALMIAVQWRRWMHRKHAPFLQHTTTT